MGHGGSGFQQSFMGQPAPAQFGYNQMGGYGMQGMQQYPPQPMFGQPQPQMSYGMPLQQMNGYPQYGGQPYGMQPPQQMGFHQQGYMQGNPSHMMGVNMMSNVPPPQQQAQHNPFAGLGL
jgi:hypothetical protein